jgi:tetratricopeptide (TPR) repeat protein
MSGQWKETIPVAEQVLATTPKSPKALRYIARSYYALKNTPKAVEAYLNLEKADTLQLDDVRQLASCYVEQKNDSLAVSRLEQVLAKDSSLNALYNELGSAYMRMKQWDKAADAFQKRFQKDTTAIGAMINYALCNMVQQNWEQAETALEKVIELKPDNIYGHLYLARTYMQTERLKDAKKPYEMVVKLAAGQEEKFKKELAEAYKILGLLLLINKNYPPALEQLNNSIKLNDDDPQTHLWKAQTLQSMTKKEDACKEYKKALKLDPKNKEAKKGIDILGCD